MLHQCELQDIQSFQTLHQTCSVLLLTTHINPCHVIILILIVLMYTMLRLLTVPMYCQLQPGNSCSGEHHQSKSRVEDQLQPRMDLVRVFQEREVYKVNRGTKHGLLVQLII